MADVFSRKKRSEIMSKIRGTDTGPEKAVRKILFSKGYRFRTNVKGLPGTPDIVLKKWKTVIFVNGCFWHGHSARECRNATIPKTNRSFWVEKISGNKKRDHLNERRLRKLGWHVLRIWECQVKKGSFDSLLKRLEKIKNEAIFHTTEQR